MLAASKMGPVEKKIFAGIERGVNAARRGFSAGLNDVAPALPRAQMSISINGVPVNQQPQHATVFGASTTFGHAPQQQPNRGPAPSDTPKPGK
ncbi:MAG: hypothetical protein CMF39_00220 [Legionellaceae bacterium]|nr:hypothetical protein [Legionellaceae bacterium]|tara:strand:- start:421 stop:699 length:279 start_codon:yes stop_codon:yes gene_type:complete